jgi:hypothetical protein
MKSIEFSRIMIVAFSKQIYSAWTSLFFDLPSYRPHAIIKIKLVAYTAAVYMH